MDKENTEGLKKGYKCVKKTKEKIGRIKHCVVLPKWRATSMGGGGGVGGADMERRGRKNMKECSKSLSD